MNTNVISIDYCPLERIPELQAFIDTYWQEAHILARDTELLRWQYPSEVPGQLSIFTAKMGDELVGMLGIIPFSFCLKGEAVPGAWLTMWMAKSEQRTQWVGLRLLQQVFKEGFPMIGTLGGNAMAQSFLGASKFDIWDAIPRWVRVISLPTLEQLLAGYRDHYSPEVWAAWQATLQSPAVSPVETANVQVVAWRDEVAERWDLAWREKFAPSLLGTWRDAAYLRWRYVDHPRFQYEVCFAEETQSQSIVGLLVYRIETVKNRTEKVIRVVEFLSQEPAGNVLAQVILEAGQAHEAAFADFYCTSPLFAEPLEALGFVQENDLPAPLPSRLQPLDLKRDRLTGAFWIKPEVAKDPALFFRDTALYLTRSDCDQDRPN